MLPNIRQFATMKRYYFDLRDGDALAPDEEGLDLSGIEAAQVEAAGFLVDVAKNAVLGSAKHGEVHNMAIEVRDGNGPVLTAKLTFEKIQPIS